MMKIINRHIVVGIFATLFLIITSIPDDLYFEITIFESVIFGVFMGLISLYIHKKKNK